ncbi:MAG: oligosaccharide flippase family protein [Gemmatimonas sp.]
MIGNFGVLASGHALGLIMPLLTVPYLARVLKPEGWAPVLVAQAMAAWLTLLLDYGFDLSATRSIAQARGRAHDATRHLAGTDAHELAFIVWRVQYAKLLLVPLAIIPVALAHAFIPAFAMSLSLIGWTAAFGIIRGLNPLWFFQGIEDVRLAVIIDTAGKVMPALAVFALIRDPADGWKVLALQAVFGGLACATLTLRLLRMVPPSPWSGSGALDALRESWPLFAFRASGTLYMQANTIILGVYSSPLAVTAYGGAERIIRAALNLLEPVSRLLLPRISYLSSSNPAEAGALIRRSLWWLGMGSAAAGAIAALLAPVLVRVLLGEGYESAVPVLRWLALLLPTITVATVLGTFWALPWKKDRLVLTATLVAGAVNLSLAALLVPRMQAQGMATAVVAAELIVALTLTVAYVRRDTRPSRGTVVTS